MMGITVPPIKNTGSNIKQTPTKYRQSVIHQAMTTHMRNTGSHLLNLNMANPQSPDRENVFVPNTPQFKPRHVPKEPTIVDKSDEEQSNIAEIVHQNYIHVWN